MRLLQVLRGKTGKEIFKREDAKGKVQMPRRRPAQAPAGVCCWKEQTWLPNRGGTPPPAAPPG